MSKTLGGHEEVIASLSERPPRTLLEIPPNPQFGELSTSVCFDLSKRLAEKPVALAEMIVRGVDLSKAKLVKSVEVAGGGYINFHAQYADLSGLAIESARSPEHTYGHVKIEHPTKTIVEHTSVNPAGPIHVGTARNSVIGDALSRLLQARGYDVATHFYVDDVGRQIAVVTYGHRLLGFREPEGKPDHWVGFVYAATSCLMAIRSLKARIEWLKVEPGWEEELRKAQRELDGWIASAAELHEKDANLLNLLIERMGRDPDPEGSVSEIMRLYEGGDQTVKEEVRRVVELCLGGFRTTYARMGIGWDSWDWESDLVWSGAVRRVMERLRRSPYFVETSGTLTVDVERAAIEMGLKTLFGVSEDYEIPPLVLMRSDGTTLYTTRDIAYSLWKFERAEKAINVIGAEQTLAQLQLRIALSLLTSPEKAKNLIHYAYELVDLPGYKMSKRRGRYITLDEIVDESVKRAREEVEERSPALTSEVKEGIAEAVGIGAVKYALISVAPAKPVIFTWEKVLNFEMNSAPFIQYAHARARNILQKAQIEPESPDYSLLNSTREQELVKRVALFPEVFLEAADKLMPSMVAEFANDLAARFNSFYAALPVIKAEKAGLRDARLALVDAVRITLRNALRLLGIEALERM